MKGDALSSDEIKYMQFGEIFYLRIGFMCS